MLSSINPHRKLASTASKSFMFLAVAVSRFSLWFQVFYFGKPVSTILRFYPNVGILSEYVSMIHEESRRRPNFIMSELVGLSRNLSPDQYG